MKKIFFTIITLCFITYSNAQDPQLLDNTWYLQEVVLDDVAQLPPSESAVTTMIATTDSIIISTVACAESGGGIIQNYVQENTFTLEDGVGVILLGVCKPPISTFLEDHYLVYGTIEGIAKNPLAYQFDTIDGTLTLTVTNPDGDMAVYTNELLSIEGFTTTGFEIYPNPVKDQLFIASTAETSFYNVIMYDIHGNRVLSLANHNIRSGIAVQKLAGGMYFVVLEDEKGQTVMKKFIKK